MNLWQDLLFGWLHNNDAIPTMDRTVQWSIIWCKRQRLNDSANFSLAKVSGEYISSETSQIFVTFRENIYPTKPVSKTDYSWEVLSLEVTIKIRPHSLTKPYSLNIKNTENVDDLKVAFKMPIHISDILHCIIWFQLQDCKIILIISKVISFKSH